MADMKREFGERVRFLRQERGLTQEQIAVKAGLHVTYVSGVERGEYNVSLENIHKLATALGVQVPDLFGGERAPARPSEAEKLRAEIARLVKRQPAAKLRTLVNVLRELTSGR